MMEKLDVVGVKGLFGKVLPQYQNPPDRKAKSLMTPVGPDIMKGTWDDPTQWPPVMDDMIIASIRKGIASLPKITYRQLIDAPNWPKSKGSEWTQLNKYNKRGMFGEPCLRPLETASLFSLLVTTNTKRRTP
jgi:hypothetical protein